ncbi:MAG TPA: hypothetical protein VFT52_08135 [Luteimonas sp.]|jgi:hypothetical protein|nr:hypothetical protein [Luteimonas sp.]
MRAVAALAVVAALAAAGCDRKARLAEQAAAQAAAAEDAAKQGEAAFDAAVADGNWALAKAQGDVLLAQYPRSQAAARVKPMLAEVAAKAQAQREGARLAGLWSYQVEPVKGGDQRSASIYAKDDVDVDGSGPSQVRLIFRDHPSWGKSSYLVLQKGDFDCYRGCRVKVTADGKVHRLPASRPTTDEAIAMFIDDRKALWKLATTSKVLEIEFPAKDVGLRTATFETGGLDASKLPAW